MPSLDETSPYLVAHLRALMDEYGPKGVYDTCAQLVNGGGRVLPDPRVKAMVQLTGDGDYDEPHAYPEHADAAQHAYDALPDASTFADVVSAAQDPAPVQVETHEVTPASFDSHEDWQQWRRDHGVDPQNIGPMGNR